ncbi:MAG: flippase [Dyadobacter fermentans]
MGNSQSNYHNRLKATSSMFYTAVAKIKSKVQNPVVLNVAWLALDKASRLLIGLVVGVWVARYLGPAHWGEINYTAAIVGIITTIANLGMDGFLVKEIVASPEQKNEILGTAFFTRLAFIPVGIAATFCYFYFTNAPDYYYYLFAFLSPSFLISPFDLIDLEFQSRLKSKLTVVCKNIGYFIGAAIKIYCLLTHKSVFWFAAAIGIETLFAYIFLIFKYQSEQNIFNWIFKKKRARQLLSTGWPFIVSNLAVILYMRIDQLMIGNIAGETELGLFSSTTKITDMFVFIPMAISGSYLSVLVKIKKEQSDEVFIRKICTFFGWMTRISIGVAIVISLLSQQIIQLLYGPEYHPAYSILAIHIWALVPMFLGVASGQYLIIENLQKYNVYKTLIGLTLNVLLNVILIPKMGAVGAAIATLISYYVSAIFSNFLFSSTKKLFRYQLRSFQMIFSFKS